MDNTEKPKVYVCLDCSAEGQPTAPVSCVTCRVSMCAHLWQEMSACRFHGLARQFGIELDIEAL